VAKVPTIEARVANYVVDDLRRRRAPIDGLLKEVNLRRIDLADPEARLPYASVFGLIERAATLVGDHSFGLRLGASRDTRERGLLGFLILNSPTLMDAITNLKRYVRVAGESEDFEIEHSNAQVALRFRPIDQAMHGLRHNSDYIAATVVRACRDITRRHISPIRAEFIHGQPNAKVAYPEFLGCPVKFKAQWDALVFTEETTHLPVKDADDKLLHVLEAAGRRIIGPSPKKRELVHEVREFIVERLPKGTASIEAIAGELNMSSKTLERRLTAHDQSFTGLRDEVRCDTAKHYLAESDMRLSQVAYMAGYTEPAALVRAFKRWTGQTPMKFREQHR